MRFIISTVKTTTSNRKAKFDLEWSRHNAHSVTNQNHTNKLSLTRLSHRGCEVEGGGGGGRGRGSRGGDADEVVGDGLGDRDCAHFQFIVGF